jgi:heme-degrading monooxygenase HmoA
VYASLTTVRGGGTDVSATAGMAAESMLSWLREFDGYRGLVVLGDPSTGNARIVTFWDSLEAVERSDKSRREVRESMIAAAGAQLESVERYELFVGKDLPTTTAPEPGAETPEVARFTTFAGPPAGIEEGLRTFREELVVWFRDATGFRGWIALLDAPNGRSIGITLWSSKDDLADDVASGAGLRNEIAAGLDTEVTGVEHYEVVMIDLAQTAEEG